MERLGRTSVYRINYELLGNFYHVEKGAKDQPFKFLERDHRHAIVFDKEERQLVAPQSRCRKMKLFCPRQPGRSLRMM